MICFYFQVHQPLRLKRTRSWDRPEDLFDHFDWDKNRELFDRITNKCYLPATALIMDLLDRYEEFKVSFSLSGVWVEQCKLFKPELLDLFNELCKRKNVELLGETYYHSLSSLYEEQDEFKEQVEIHKKAMKELFGSYPQVFRNTELIYDNRLVRTVKEMGFKGVLTEGTERILGWRSPNYLYKPFHLDGISVLLKNYRLSDDIAFRFSTWQWDEYPLTADKYAGWLSKERGDCVNLFMDYETFGEHQWKETGIFEFLEHLPGYALERGLSFAKPSELVEKFSPVGTIDVPFAISWADIERDVSAWLDNEMQQESFNNVRDLKRLVKAKGDIDLIHFWRLLQTSDHFYYMSTKWYDEDQDVHTYFNPYKSPYIAFINYTNALADLRSRLG
jgi:alpha-amylase